MKKNRGLMGKYDGVLLMSDFDGTLYCDGTVSEENREAIRSFQQQGGLFSLASGRFPSWIDECRKYFVPNACCAMLNGALICDPDSKKPVYELPLGEEIIDISETVRRYCPQLKRVLFHTYDRTKTFLPDEPLDISLIPFPIFKVLYYTPAECSDEYTSVITGLAGDSYNVCRSWINGIELQMPDSTKGGALKRLRTMLGSRAALTVAVGDYENDISMLQAADIGYAVDNALPQVKAASDRVTVGYSENAIAKIISEL